MSTSHEPAIAPPTPLRGGHKAPSGDTPVAPEKSAVVRNQFVIMALNMSWQLALVVLVPIILGVKLGKVAGADTAGTFIGLGIAVIGSIAVMWRTLQTANSLPVPKLTATQRRAIRKQYEEEDNE
ncbi:MAG TPA: AtpZ/AtpI family protein [Verrucomicrobiae bacterium]|nr:AtpZ/AtpI family protein [Verrucomicrobiae bacterium]